MKRQNSDLIRRVCGYLTQVQDFGAFSSVDSFNKLPNDDEASSSEAASSAHTDLAQHNYDPPFTTPPISPRGGIMTYVRMNVAFRISPLMPGYQYQELVFSPRQIEKLAGNCGLSRLRPDLSTSAVCESSTLGRGLRMILSDFVEDIHVTKVLVELLTESPGSYGRYVALVVLGVGCTVLYVVEPTSVVQETLVNAPGRGVLGGRAIADNLADLDYRHPGTMVAKYLQTGETGDVSLAVESFMKEKPFKDLGITASGLVLTAAGVGLMLAIAVAAGVEPTAAQWN